MKVLILGAGKMVEAILDGLKDETDLSRFYVYSPSGKSAEILAKKVGINFAATLDEVKDPAWVWLGCKPQQFKDLAHSIQGKYPNATYVSMLAALAEADQLKFLGASKLIRIMPNMPVKYKKGVTLLSSSSAPQELKLVKTLFSHIGLAKEVKESELEELTLLTGSGPAFFYEFTKILAGCFTSLTEKEREDLARMVLTGSGASIESSPEVLSTMINNVTSKAGVTIAVLENWRNSKLTALVQDGVLAGNARSVEIGESIRRS
jgi:pyrroline-5-carboxylate reductase